MLKYYAAFKYEFADNVQYKIALLFHTIIFALIMYIMMNVWNYLYDSPSTYIVGYSYPQMIWYVILTELLWFSTRSFILNNQIGSDIRSGNISVYMNKPYNYIGFIFFRYLGEISVNLLNYLPMGAIIGILYLYVFPKHNILSAFSFILSFILSIVINGLIRLVLGMSSFWIENTQPLIWLYEKLILIIGTIFPIELFPEWIQNILMRTPIYVISYGPAKLFVDFHKDIFRHIIFMQALYIVAGLLLLWMVYKKGRIKIDINGG